MVALNTSMIVNTAMMNNIQIDFVWSTQKGMSSLYPLYKMALSQGWDSNLYKVKKHFFLNLLAIQDIKPNHHSG